MAASHVTMAAVASMSTSHDSSCLSSAPSSLEAQASLLWLALEFSGSLWAPVFALKCQVRLAASLAFSTVLRQVDSGIVTPERGYLVHVWPEEPEALTRPKSFWGGAAGSRMSGNRSLSGFLAFLPRTSCAPGDLSDHLMRWRLTGVVTSLSVGTASTSLEMHKIQVAKQQRDKIWLGTRSMSLPYWGWFSSLALLWSLVRFDASVWYVKISGFKSPSEEILHSLMLFVCIWDCTRVCMGLIT